MFESEDIKRLNEERREVSEYLEEKYQGVFPLIDLVTDIIVEVKRIQDRLDAIENVKVKRVKNG